MNFTSWEQRNCWHTLTLLLKPEQNMRHEAVPLTWKVHELWFECLNLHITYKAHYIFPTINTPIRHLLPVLFLFVFVSFCFLLLNPVPPTLRLAYIVIITYIYFILRLLQQFFTHHIFEIIQRATRLANYYWILINYNFNAIFQLVCRKLNNASTMK